jgi:hemerythrin-like metal-binding protein
MESAIAFLNWSRYFETGLELVDKQHHALVDMVNQAAPHLAMNDDMAKRAVGPLLDNLTRYALIHFRDEEHLMMQREMAPAYLTQHHRAHQMFVDQVTAMRKQYEQAGTLTGTDLLRFLSSWLSFHILLEDQRMATQLRDMDNGRSAQQAFEQVNQTQDGAHAVYNSAMLDLFTLLTERNHKLELANAEVLKAHEALQMANQSLETRVQERTSDLAATVQRLEQTQTQLLQSEKMAAVGQLAAGVAHEINNPIGFVTSNVGTLSDDIKQLFDLLDMYHGLSTDLPREQQAVAVAALQQADLDYLRNDVPSLIRESLDGLSRVKRIVSDLRDFSRADDGQWVATDLNEILESALNVVANEIKFKASVVKELITLPPVICIASQINQVLVNLLVNAAQAIGQKGVITLRTGIQADQAWLEVSDNGCGMPAEIQRRIFEPFYTTKPVGKGTGLGLSISWEIIQRHQGAIDVRSAPGQGTTFRITLPLKGHTQEAIA